MSKSGCGWAAAARAPRRSLHALLGMSMVAVESHREPKLSTPGKWLGALRPGDGVRETAIRAFRARVRPQRNLVREPIKFPP